MSTECHEKACPHHCTNETPPDEGPFCHESVCRQAWRFNELLPIVEMLINSADKSPFCSIGYFVEHVVPNCREIVANMKRETKL